MGDMADLISDYGFDYEEWYDQEIPFKIECKWCGKRITMTPTDDGWKPMFRSKIHVCDERRKELLNLMPDER
jgi:hypothetical protein